MLTLVFEVETIPYSSKRTAVEEGGKEATMTSPRSKRRLVGDEGGQGAERSLVLYSIFCQCSQLSDRQCLMSMCAEGPGVMLDQTHCLEGKRHLTALLSVPLQGQ